MAMLMVIEYSFLNIICTYIRFFLHMYSNKFDNIILGSFLHRNPRTASVLLKDTRMYQVACIYMLTRLFINLCQIYMPLYLHESLNMPATSLAYIPLTMYLSSFLTSLIIERLNTKWGRKVAYSIGVLFAICACIWIQFGNGDIYIKYEIYVVAVLLGNSHTHTRARAHTQNF